jgi:large subunit ribosomal protein L29
MMKAVDLREMTIEELRTRERELAEEVARLRIQVSIKRLDNPRQVRIAKRDLARVKTIINERQRAEAGTQQEPGAGGKA